jgi:hypothetical protein
MKNRQNLSRAKKGNKQRIKRQGQNKSNDPTQKEWPTCENDSEMVRKSGASSDNNEERR